MITLATFDKGFTTFYLDVNEDFFIVSKDENEIYRSKDQEEAFAKLKVLALERDAEVKIHLGDIVVKAIAGAKASRGANKGQLKAKCPPVDTPEAAAWQAIMAKANPFKTGLGHMLFMSKPNRVIYNCIEHAIENGKIDVRGLDRDRKALENLNIW